MVSLPPKFHIVEEKGEFVIRADCGGIYGRHATLAEAREAQTAWEHYFEEPFPQSGGGQ